MPSDKEWTKKQNRELFCKTVNALMMTNKDLELETAMDMAEKVIRKALELFPPADENGEEVIDLPNS